MCVRARVIANVWQTLYKRIQELISENEMLHLQHSKYVHLGVLKHKSD